MQQNMVDRVTFTGVGMRQNMVDCIAVFPRKLVYAKFAPPPLSPPS